jgi:hypothetical protein
MTTVDGKVLNDFRAVVQSLRACEIWSVGAGPSTGSHVSFEIGPKRPRRVPLTNPAISEQERLYEGTYSMLISCAWRLDGRSGVMSSWRSDDFSGGMMSAVASLIGTCVENVRLDLPGLDFRLHLTGGMTFSVFADEVEGADARDNYYISTEDTIYVVAPNSVLRAEPRRDEGRVVLRQV